MKVITWVDPEGRYRVTSPAYDDPTRPKDETEDECIARVEARLRIVYGLPASQVFHHVEDADQRTRVAECAGTCFRYPVTEEKGPDERWDGKGGAWKMDSDGRPKVNMVKARGIQMDRIRVVRDAELARLDIDALRAVGTGDTVEQTAIEAKKQALRDIPQTFDLKGYKIPTDLKAAWPPELPKEALRA